MRLSKGAPPAELGFDMTPMIDVTFLLIIFFVMVSELTRMEITADVLLPMAEQANVEDAPDRTRLIINVEKDGGLFLLGQKRSMDELRTLLAAEAKMAMGPDGFSDRSVVIRGHKDLKYERVQEIMLECRKQRIWRLSFAAERPEDAGR
ncbi:MAG: biopolymer transporter ExbD [Planctomycetes bacterium]|nr:biopolymer transporter ExbD [Planctomycetota bacterium]MBM4081531.1 biopolymer transporter ExbD [Planctomycetota bacterium]